MPACGRKFGEEAAQAELEHITSQLDKGERVTKNIFDKLELYDFAWTPETIKQVSDVKVMWQTKQGV